MQGVNGIYLKGKGYTQIFACARYESGVEFPMCVVGAGLTFEIAMRYAGSDVNNYLDRGWQIDMEYEEHNFYECVLLSPNGIDHVRIVANLCPLVHE